MLSKFILKDVISFESFQSVKKQLLVFDALLHIRRRRLDCGMFHSRKLAILEFEGRKWKIRLSFTD